MKVKCAPPNSIVFILDPNNLAARIPEYLDGQLISSNNDCISIGTQFEAEGDTDIFLDDAEIICSENDAKFEACINTPSREIAIVNSHNEVILKKQVNKERTLVKIYANDDMFPDLISIKIT